MGESNTALPLRHKQPTPFGKEMAKHFLFDPSYRNLNHGSFGTYPRQVKERFQELQELHEQKPDVFIRYVYPKLLDESRAAVAKLLNVPTETCVFVPNATTAVNTVLRNLTWSPDGKDQILYFSFIYGACGKTIDYVCEANLDLVTPRIIPVPIPFTDTQLITLLQTAITDSRAAGHRPRLAIFDTIVSQPGISLPFQALTALCKTEGLLSLIDGAHGIGHIPLDLSALQPDFFCSNLHKWLFVPRGCSVLYTPVNHQPLIRSTLPTSHGFIPRGQTQNLGPLPASTTQRSTFETNFNFVGTIDSSPYLCVLAALKFRNKICGGEQAIMKYNTDLAKAGGKKVAEILGTEILDNEEKTLTNCCMVNILLPDFGPSVKEDDIPKAANWITEKLMDEFATFIPNIMIEGRLYVRLSAQVYLDVGDFEWAGTVLKGLCERVGKGEFLL